jgi:hypothetical protein
MAAIIDDGPRHWVTDTLNRKLGRVAAMSNGTLMLLVVTTIDPGTARIVLAVGAVTLIGYACRPQPATCPATTTDLAEVEAIVMERLDDMEREACVSIRGARDELARLRQSIERGA